MKTFSELGLSSEILKSLDDLGFTEPSPVQEKAIPFILKSKKDLIALAQTGTGKTAAFGLPILNQVKANEKDLVSIILCPTRELCMQISQDLRRYAKHSKGIIITPVYGGERIDLQIRALRSGTNIVVGTPGRVHDLIRRKNLKLQKVKWLVLDEADEMLDMGFKEDLDVILSETPENRQTLLFSATISKSVSKIAQQYMHDTEEISIGEKNVGAANVSHEYYVVQGRDRFDALKRILDSLPGVYGILFCRTRIETQEISDKLKQANYDTEALHGEISQVMRTKIMDRFKRKQVRLLVATDVAARGIDVSDLTHVINYNLPDQYESYTHRSGRTGRAQKSGVCISFLTPRETGAVKTLENIIGKKFEFKKVPSGEDIRRNQIDLFLQEIEAAKQEDTGDKKDFVEVIEKLKKFRKEDLIKYFISQKFNQLASANKDVYDLNAQAKPAGPRLENANSTNLRINFGRRHGFDIKSVFTIINSSKDLKGIDIGKINLMPEYSIFSVGKQYADDVVRHLDGTNFRGKRIEIATSNESVGNSSGRKSRPGGGFKGKKRGFRKARY